MCKDCEVGVENLAVWLVPLLLKKSISFNVVCFRDFWIDVAAVACRSVFAGYCRCNICILKSPQSSKSVGCRSWLLSDIVARFFPYFNIAYRTSSSHSLNPYFLIFHP